MPFHDDGCDCSGCNWIPFPPKVSVPERRPKEPECYWPREGRPCAKGTGCRACLIRYGRQACEAAPPWSAEEQAAYEEYIRAKAQAVLPALLDGDYWPSRARLG